MKSVGEVMSIGRTFKEAFQKAICSLENGLCGLEEIDFRTGDLLDKEQEVKEAAESFASKLLFIYFRGISPRIRRGRNI